MGSPQMEETCLRNLPLGRPESFLADWDKEPFVENPTLRDISLLLLTPFPLSQTQGGKQRLGPFTEQIFDFSTTAQRRNHEEPVKIELQLVSNRKSKTIRNPERGRS